MSNLCESISSATFGFTLCRIGSHITKKQHMLIDSVISFIFKYHKKSTKGIEKQDNREPLSHSAASIKG